MGGGVAVQPWKLPWSHTFRQRLRVYVAPPQCMTFRQCMMSCVLTLAPPTPLPHRRIRLMCMVLLFHFPSYNRAFPVTGFSPLVGVKTVTGNATIAWTVRFSHLCQVLICALFSLLCCIPRRRLTHRWGWGIPLGIPLTNQVGQPTALLALFLAPLFLLFFLSFAPQVFCRMCEVAFTPQRGVECHSLCEACRALPTPKRLRLNMGSHRKAGPPD